MGRALQGVPAAPREFLREPLHQDRADDAGHRRYRGYADHDIRRPHGLPRHRESIAEFARAAKGQERDPAHRSGHLRRLDDVRRVRRAPVPPSSRGLPPMRRRVRSRKSPTPRALIGRGGISSPTSRAPGCPCRRARVSSSNAASAFAALVPRCCRAHGMSRELDAAPAAKPGYAHRRTGNDISGDRGSNGDRSAD